MSGEQLENLVKINKLKKEPCPRKEYEGYIKSGKNRLADAANESLTEDSRFDLAYSAAHALAVAALRRKGYRSEDRYIVFQVLPHTVGLDAASMRVFAKAHNERNLMEYEGRADIDKAFLAELLKHAQALEKIVAALDPPP